MTAVWYVSRSDLKKMDWKLQKVLLTFPFEG